MIILPIVSRELRVAARRPATYWTRFSAAVFTVLLASWIILVMRNVPSARVGAALFSALSVLLFAFCLLAGVANTADCMAEEKREGTLGLLFLTDLRGFDVVLGKFAANSMTSVYGLLAAAPVLALPLLLGGVAPQAFWQMVLHLLNALFFSLSAGMLVSSLSSDSRRAVIGTFFLVLAFAGGLPLAGWIDASFIGQTRTGLAPAYLLPSPGYGFSLALEGAFRTRATSPIWNSFLIVHLLGWSFLATSTLIVPRTWKDRPATVRGTRLRDWWRHWAYGNPVQRRSFRAQSLEANPISWLGARYRPKRVLVWVFLGGAGVVWLWGYIRLRHDWLNAGVGIWVMFLAHTVMKYWVALEAGRLFHELRRNGSFELLLSTPIKIPEILAGQLLGLRFQFGAPILLLLMADAVLLVFGLKNESGDFSERRDIALVYAAIMGMLIMDYFALAWVGMWHGLCARRIQRAVSATLSIVLLFPWLIFIGTVIMYGALRLDRIYEPKTPIPLFLWWFAIGATIDWLAIAWARSRLEGQFRHRVAEQFSAPPRRWWRLWVNAKVQSQREGAEGGG